MPSASYWVQLTSLSKGKAERFIRHIRSALYPELCDAAYTSREERNAALQAWIEQVYHRNVHSQTKQTPLARYLADPPPRCTDQQIYQAFLLRCNRKVTKACTFQVDGHTYETHSIFARQTIEVRYDAQDPAHKVTIFMDGNKIDSAFPTRPAPRINRRIQGPTALPSSQAGKQYLNALRKEHNESMIPQPHEAPIATCDDDRLLLGQFLDHLRLQHVAGSPAEEREAAAFFQEHGPFDRHLAMEALRRAIALKGLQQHISYYLGALTAASLPKEQRS